MSVPTRIKICYVLGSLQYGGAEGQVLELIKGLDRERFEASLILERDNDCGRRMAACPYCCLAQRLALNQLDTKACLQRTDGVNALLQILVRGRSTYCPRLSSSSVYLGCQRALTGERPLSRS